VLLTEADVMVFGDAKKVVEGTGKAIE